MVYTTYFAQIRQLPPNVIPISICAKAPTGYTGIQYKKLAPNYDLLQQWKRDHDDSNYTRRYTSEVLGRLNFQRVIDELQVALPFEVKCQMQTPFWRSEQWHVALVCYEKPTNFCHRHLVAEWFKQHSIPCRELTSEDWATFAL